MANRGHSWHQPGAILMGVWIRAFINQPAGKLSTETTKKSIEDRLALLNSLFCPDEEEPIADVLKRLTLEAEKEDLLKIGYRKDAVPKLLLERWKAEKAKKKVDELLENMPSAAAYQPIRKSLKECVETLGLRLTQKDVKGMGLPVAVSALHHWAWSFKGQIHIEDRGWYQPTEKELKLLVEE
jgi:hypothetical protein